MSIRDILTSENGQALIPEDLEGTYPVRAGMILVAPHSQMIARKQKTLIVKSRPYTKYVGVPLYVVQESRVWALINYQAPRKISLDDFSSLRGKHRISEKERKQWWPKAESFYAYEFKLIESYDPPLKTQLPTGPQIFVQRVEIQSQKDVENIQVSEESSNLLYDLSPPNYPTEAFLELRELAEDFPELIVWIPKFISIAPLPSTGEFSIQCKAAWKNNSLKIDLDVESPVMREIWDLFNPLQRDFHWVPSTFGPNWTYFPIYDLSLALRNETSLPAELKERIPPSMIWIPEFLSTSGSSIYAKNRNPNDIDLVLRAEDGPNTFELMLDKSLNLKLSRVLDAYLRWNSPDFKDTDHIPAWDLCLTKRKPLEVRIVQEPEFAALYYKAMPSKRAEAKLRAGSPEVRRQAEQSLKKDAIEPRCAFYSLKPFRGAVAGEHMTLDSFFGLLKAEDFPMWSSTKRDGVTCLWAKEGDWVRVLSDDGEDLTRRLGPLVDQFKRISPSKLVLCTEVEAWRGNQHFPREKAAGILKSGRGIEQLIVQIFDCVYHSEDIHKRPFSERYAIFSKLNLKNAPKFRIIRHTNAGSVSSLKRIAMRDIKANGSEGCVVKRGNAIFPLTGEPGRTRCAFKYHLNATIRGLVLGAMKTKGGAWVHRYGLLPGKMKPTKIEKVGEKEYAVVGRTFARAARYPRGSTINVECETLNEIRRADGTTSVTLWVPNLIAKVDASPMTMDEAIKEAKRCGVLQVKVVDAKGNIEYLPTDPARIIKGYEWNESFDPLETDDLLKAAELFLKAQRPPSEKGIYRYVVQSHWRGKSNHKDFRAQFNKYLWGRTLLDQIAGQTKEPVVTLAQAKREDARDIWKFNWRKGEIKKRRIRDGQIRRAQIRVEAKARQIPHDWFKVEGVTRRPEPGERPPAGATRKYPGVFHIIDRGTVEYGAFKPWFQELFLSKGKMREGRWLFRMIQRQATKDIDIWPDLDLLAVWEDYSEEEKSAYWFVGETLVERGIIFEAEVEKTDLKIDLKKLEELLAQEFGPPFLDENIVEATAEPDDTFILRIGPRDIHIDRNGKLLGAGTDIRDKLIYVVERAILPPGKIEERPRGPSYWTLIQPEEAERWSPYVLSRRAINANWLPPRGYSALPRSFRSKVPKHLRYWNMERKAALKARRELEKVEELGGPGKLKKEASKAEAKPFHLEFHSWRGPIVIRFGRSDWHWNLRIKENGSIWHLVLNEGGDSPLEAEVSMGVEKPCRADATVQTGTWDGKKFKPDGRIRIMDIKMGQEVGLKPGTKANPTIETPAWIETIDIGTATLVDQGPDWRKYNFKGKKLKGTYVFHKEKGARNWQMSKSEGPKMKTIVDEEERPGINISAVRKTPLKPEKFDDCMLRDCDKPAQIEVLWADGRALARFCRDDYLKWYEDMQGEGADPTEIVRAYICEGEATKDVDEETSVVEADEAFVKPEKPQYNKQGRPQLYSKKQADGRWRWVMIDSTAVLDKIGEIVSRKAVDKGVDRAQASGELGDLLFWHIPWLRFGACDFQAREGLCLIESGLWDDTPAAQKARETTSQHPEAWGASIGFKGLEVQENIQILGRKVKRVYNDIIFKERSILPEWAACAHFTSISTTGDEEMKATQEEALRLLIGDEDTDEILEKARDIEDKVMASGLVFKGADSDDPPEDTESEEEKAAKKPKREEDEDNICPEDYKKPKKDGKKKAEDDEEEEEEDEEEGKTLGGLVGAIQTKLTALRKKVSGDAAEAVDDLIDLAKNLRGYGRAGAYPAPKKEELSAEEEIVQLRGQMGTVAEAVLSLSRLVKNIQEKATEEEKAAKKPKKPEEEEEEEDKKKAKDEQEEETEEKSVKDLLEDVRQEMRDLKTRLDEATQPVRKSALPSDDEEAVETKEAPIDLTGYSDDQIRGILHAGLQRISQKKA